MTAMLSGRYPDVGNLPKRVELAPGFDPTDAVDDWPWIDISTGLHESAGIEVKRGCGDEDSQTASSLTMMLDNTSGRFTVDNPESDLWPLLDTDEPIPLRFAIDVGDGAGWRVWYVGMVTSVENTWDGGEYRSLTKVDAVGILTTLGQTDSVTVPFEAYILDTQVPAYLYSMVGGAYDQAGVAAIPGAPSTFIDQSVGRLDFSKIAGPAGAPAALPEYVTGDTTQVAYTLRTPTDSADYSVEWVIRIQPGDSGYGASLIYLELQTYALYVNLWRRNTGGTFDSLLDFGSAPRGLGGGSVATYTIADNPADSEWHLARLDSYQSGGRQLYDVSLDGVLQQTIDWDTAANGQALAAVLPIALARGDYAATSSSAGYFAVYESGVTGDAVPAMLGYAGEQAHERALRVCSENGIPFACAGTVSETMGPQPVGNLVAVLRDCEATDRGIMDDSFGEIRYLTREEIYTNGVDLVIDGAQHGTPLSFKPTRNESKRRNRMVVKDKAGVQAEWTSPDSSGRFFAGSIDVNVDEPTRLLPYAQWFVAIGTSKGYRYPELPIDLLRNPTLVNEWLSIALGSRLEFRNPPRQHAKGSLYQQVRGIAESFRGRRWRAVMNTVSTRPYEVMVRGAAGDRRDGSHSTVAVPVGAALPNASENVLVFTHDHALWTVDPLEMPFDVNLDGERTTLTAASSPIVDTFTRTVAGGWGTVETGTGWATNGATAAQLSVNGSAGVISAATLSVNYVLTATATGLTASNHDVSVTVAFPSAPVSSYLSAGVVARFASTTSFYQGEFRVSPTGAITLVVARQSGGVQTTLGTHALAGTGGYVATATYRVRLRVVGDELSFKAWNLVDSEPYGWNVETYDSTLTTGAAVGCYGYNGSSGTKVINYDAFQLNSPQVLTLTRAVDKVVRAHAVGSPVSLWRPLVRGL